MAKIKFFFTVNHKDSPFIGQLINAVTKQKQTHVGIIYDKDDEWYYGGESLAKGFVNHKMWKNWIDAQVNQKKMQILEFNVRQSKQQIGELLNNLEGTPYGFFDYIKFIVYFLTGKKMFKESSTSMVCSESAAYVAAHLGLIEAQDDYDYITPGDLYNLLHDMLMRHNIDNALKKDKFYYE